jgi:hypothetical protein
MKMKDLTQNLLRHGQREQLKSEIAEADRMLPFAKPDEKGAVMARRQRTQQQLDQQSPEPLTGKEKDTLAALEKKLRSKITHNMPTEEVMRKNPAGAVDWHQRWERANKKAIRIWKNVRIQLNPDSSDRDLANIERYRPSGQTDRMRTDAQIPGLMSYGNIDESQWPFEAPQNTALAQAKKVYSEQEAEHAVNEALDQADREERVQHLVNEEGEETEKAELSAEQHAILADRLRKAREAKAAKRLAEQQLNDISEATPVSLDAD